MTPSKATREQLREHNRRLVLRMLYQGEVNTRAALATVTGLTKPTVSNLVGELIDEGLVVEEGLGRASGSGGKRPTLLAFNPRARQVIGVALGSECVSAALADLAGETSAVHVLEPAAAAPIAPGRGAMDATGTATTGASAVLQAVEDAVVALVPQLDAPLLAVGVAVPGRVRPGTGVVRRSAVLGIVDEVPLGRLLTDRLGVPVHVGNFAELCALGQFSYGLGERTPTGTLVSMTLDDDLELGVVLHPSGAHFGSELAGPMIDELNLGWSAFKARAAELVRERPGALPWGERYLNVRRAAGDGDPGAAQLLSELAAALARPLAWVVSVLQPANVSLVGGVTDLGEGFLARLGAEATALLGAGALEDVSLSMAYSNRLGAMGAVALANRAELELIA
ncbi:MAG: ROK family transcriptional regulator [Trueperaceae bacterium]|nr:ROK family transcriptional regulator [Trueperaceae bacterium]